MKVKMTTRKKSAASPRGRYESYLLTPAWREKREQTLVRDGRACRACYSGKRLHVHHMTYERLGHELLSDLVTLCEPCHGKVHRQHKAGRKRESLTTVTQRFLGIASLDIF